MGVSMMRGGGGDTRARLSPLVVLETLSRLAGTNAPNDFDSLPSPTEERDERADSKPSRREVVRFDLGTGAVDVEATGEYTGSSAETLRRPNEDLRTRGGMALDDRDARAVEPTVPSSSLRSSGVVTPEYELDRDVEAAG